MSKNISVDTSKLLGFDKDGAALVNIVLNDGANDQLSQTAAEGEISKTISGAKMTGTDPKVGLAPSKGRGKSYFSLDR